MPPRGRSRNSEVVAKSGHEHPRLAAENNLDCQPVTGIYPTTHRGKLRVRHTLHDKVGRSGLFGPVQKVPGGAKRDRVLPQNSARTRISHSGMLFRPRISLGS